MTSVGEKKRYFISTYFCQHSPMRQAKEAMRCETLNGMSFYCVLTVWSVSCPYMKSITYTAARENLASTINRVCEDNAPVLITCNRDQAVVMLSLSEYESLQETAHLLRSPANVKRLLKSIESLERGRIVRKKLNLEA